jgi:hypothetical protein
MMTEDDIDDVLVSAEIKADKQVNEIMRKIMMPGVERAGVMMWAELPDDARQAIRTNRPDLAKYYDSKMKGR